MMSPIGTGRRFGLGNTCRPPAAVPELTDPRDLELARANAKLRDQVALLRTEGGRLRGQLTEALLRLGNVRQLVAVLSAKVAELRGAADAPHCLRASAAEYRARARRLEELVGKFETAVG